MEETVAGLTYTRETMHGSGCGCAWNTPPGPGKRCGRWWVAEDWVEPNLATPCLFNVGVLLDDRDWYGAWRRRW